MNAPLNQALFADAVRIVPAPHRSGRVFDLHPGLHVALFGGFFAYLGVMWSAFGERGLVLPFVIFAVFLAGSFIVPAWWARVAPNPGPKPSFDRFLQDGFVCETGHVTAGATMAQVLIMPIMLIGSGVAVAIIRATV